MFLTIPTLMTWTRIVAIPLIVGVFYLNIAPVERNLIATAMFVIFAATDWLDGFLARKLKQTSSFGAFLDPVADKFLVCACLLVLVHLQRADVFVALIIIGRESAISALREWMAHLDRKSTRLNSSHSQISYAVFCLKKKKKDTQEKHYIYTNGLLDELALRAESV